MKGAEIETRLVPRPFSLRSSGARPASLSLPSLTLTAEGVERVPFPWSLRPFDALAAGEKRSHRMHVASKTGCTAPFARKRHRSLAKFMRAEKAWCQPRTSLAAFVATGVRGQHARTMQQECLSVQLQKSGRNCADFFWCVLENGAAPRRAIMGCTLTTRKNS